MATKMFGSDRVPITLIGDGSTQTLGITNLIVIAKHWRQWNHPRLIILVVNHHGLARVTLETGAMEGEAKLHASTVYPNMNYAEFAINMGLGGIRIEDPRAMEDALEAAFSADKPFVIDAATDVEIHTLPPGITFAKVERYLAFALNNDPQQYGFLSQSRCDANPGMN